MTKTARNKLTDVKIRKAARPLSKALNDGGNLDLLEMPNTAALKWRVTYKLTVEKSEHAEVLWEQQIEGLLVASSKTHQALGPLPPEPRLDFDIPDNPVYRTAQSSGQLTLLSKDERKFTVRSTDSL